MDGPALIVALLCCFWSSGSTSTSSNTTFQRYFGYRLAVNISQQFVIRNFSAVNSTAIFKPCWRSCLDDERCQGFHVDFDAVTCVTYGAFYESEPSFLRMQLHSRPGCIFWRKSTEKALVDCGYWWRYDVRPGITLVMDKVDRFVPVSSMEQCQDACSGERTFPCRSALYNYITKNCHLSRHDARSSPSYFVEGDEREIYLENQCSSDWSSGCEFTAVHSAAPSFAMDSILVENGTDCEKMCLDSNQFACRSYLFLPDRKACVMGSDDAVSMGKLEENATVSLERTTHFQRDECADVRVKCGLDGMMASFRTNPAFDGRIVSMKAPDNCSFDVNGQMEFNISLSMDKKNNCGVVDQESNTVSAMVVMRYHHSVITAKDRAFKLMCKYDLTGKTVSNYVELGEANGLPNATVVSGGGRLPEAYMRIVNGDGETVTTAEVGQTLYAEVSMKGDGPTEYGLFVNQCQALDDGRNVLLVDQAGCPTDTALFQGFHPTQEGDYKKLRAAFQGFRFQTKRRITINCNVNFCFRFCHTALCTDKSGGRIMSLGRRKRYIGGVRVESGVDMVERRARWPAPLVLVLVGVSVAVICSYLWSKRRQL